MRFALSKEQATKPKKCKLRVCGLFLLLPRHKPVGLIVCNFSHNVCILGYCVCMSPFLSSANMACRFLALGALVVGCVDDTPQTSCNRSRLQPRIIMMSCSLVSLKSFYEAVLKISIGLCQIFSLHYETRNVLCEYRNMQISATRGQLQWYSPS